MQHQRSCGKNKVKVSGLRKGFAAGFTLIELLVVCSILAIVITAIAACLAGGIRVWDSARSFHVGESDAILALEHMSRDLGGTFVFPDIPFQSTRHTLSFPGIVHTEQDGQGVLGTITYAFRQGDGSLKRETMVYPAGRVRSEVLLRDARDLRFEAIALDVASSLANTGLPARVEIEMVITEHDVPMTLTRSVSMPAGGG